MRNCACAGLIERYIPVRGLVQLIREYAAEFSAERISHWLKHNGRIIITLFCSFAVRYSSPEKIIVFVNPVDWVDVITCEPENVARYLQTISELPENSRRAWANRTHDRCIKFTNNIGRKLEREVPLQCHFFDDYV